MRISVALFSLILLAGCSDGPKVKVETLPFTRPVTDSQTVAINLQDQADTLGIEKELGIEFGFSDKEESRVLLLPEDSIRKPAEFTKIISAGAIVGIKNFMGWQKATPDDNGRQSRYNFNNCAGYLYEMPDKSADNENSIVLLTEKFLSARKFIPETFGKPGESKTTLKTEYRTKIQAEKNRKIKGSLKIRDLNGEVYLVEFVPVKDSVLVSLVYIDKDKIIYLDFPAKYNEISTWRVDDGGDFGAAYFKVLAVFECNGKTEIVTDWHGAEGVFTGYYREENGKFEEIKTGSRYTAPL
jgi:hypothetical protein